MYYGGKREERKRKERVAVLIEVYIVLFNGYWLQVGPTATGGPHMQCWTGHRFFPSLVKGGEDL
jgi:hypothetical protein